MSKDENKTSGDFFAPIRELARSESERFHDHFIKHLDPGIRAPGLINGAAAAALLAFISQQKPENAVMYKNIIPSFPYLIIGVFLSAVAQTLLFPLFAMIASAIRRIPEPNDSILTVQRLQKKMLTEQGAAALIVLIILIFTVLSYFCFIRGMYIVYIELHSHF
jgi:hypothetical protein